MKLEHGNNLETLQRLKEAGAKFDLVELDGPYMAGLEGWDILTEAEYIQHYAERLTLVRDILQPWGVVFVFGYPEGCAEIKSWAHRTETLYLRRWLHWYKKLAQHRGRRIEVIAVFDHYKSKQFVEFKLDLRKKREEKGWTVKDAMIACDINVDKVTSGERGGGGFLWFEANSSRLPTVTEYKKISTVFGLGREHEKIQYVYGLTDFDIINRTYFEPTLKLNKQRLSSKPVQLYLDLFKPTIPPTETRRALVLYGGSGNAGIAAAALGYDVTICEADAARCEAIRGRWDAQVERWQRRLSQLAFTLPSNKAIQAELLCSAPRPPQAK